MKDSCTYILVLTKQNLCNMHRIAENIGFHPRFIVRIDVCIVYYKQSNKPGF